MVAQRIRDYELVMVLRPEVTDEQVTEILQRVRDMVAQADGEVTEEDRWGLRRLAYPIQKLMEGYYVQLHLSMDADRVREMERTMNTWEELLRYLVMRREG